LTIEPAETRLDIGGSRQLRAVLGTPGGSSRDVTALATWGVSDESIVRIGNGAGEGGVVWGSRSGVVDVKANFTEFTALARVIVGEDPVQTVFVTPAVVSLTLGAVVRLQATALTASGKQMDVTATATWSTSTPQILESGVEGRANAFRALANGRGMVTARLGGRAGSAEVNVESAAELKLAIGPPSATLRVGEMVGFRALANYPDGTQRNATGFATWVSQDDKVASVSRGSARCLSEGQVVITATYRGATASATLVCTRSSIAVLVLIPSDTSVPVGTQIRYSAIVFFSDGTSRPVTMDATFESSDPMIASVTREGLATASAPGTVTIRARFEDATGTATLEVVAPP
jgi:hypothetical protein